MNAWMVEIGRVSGWLSEGQIKEHVVKSVKWTKF